MEDTTFTKLQSLFKMNETVQETVKFFLINYYYIFITVAFIFLTAFFCASVFYIYREAKKIDKKYWALTLLIFIAALGVRLFVLSHHPQVYYDEVTFIETAENYYRTGLNVHNYMGPHRNEFLICSTGWPYLISLAFRIVGDADIRAAFILSALLSSLTIFLVFWSGAIIFKNEAAGVWSALIYSIIPIFLRLSTSSAMGTASIFFLFLTLLAFLLYYRQRAVVLLYFAFSALAYTINIRQEAFIALLPLLLLFFVLFHPDIKSELKNPHFYVSLLMTAVLIIPPMMASLYGVSVGFYYFYENPNVLRSNIIHNIQHNFTYWFTNKVHPIILTLLSLFGFWVYYRKDKVFCWFMAFWFISLYSFYTLNPSCDFSGLITLDSWRNAFHLLVPVVLFSGAAVSAALEYYRSLNKGIYCFAFLLMFIAVILIPIRFYDFIDQKSFHAHEYLFIQRFSGSLPKKARIIVDFSARPHYKESYMSLFSYSSRVPGFTYELDPSKPYAGRVLLRDYLRWRNQEKRPVFLYLSTTDVFKLQERQSWYFDTFHLRLLGGYGLRSIYRSYALYEITGLKKLPYYMFQYVNPYNIE